MSDMAKRKAQIGVIGGSGLYEMPELVKTGRVAVKTPFGPPSDDYELGVIEGVKVAFLARHGAGHRLLPSEINYRANVYGFKKLGVERIVSVSAVGSLREHIHPLDMVFVDQFYDRTRGRASTFFGQGLAAHVSFAHPTCADLSARLLAGARQLGLSHHAGGTYVCMEGPAFSTRAESEAYRSRGASVIGMTNLPEAKLAREAEICYATVALVTDYDCWHEEEEAVNVEAVLENLRRNAENACKLIATVVPTLPSAPGACECPSALSRAIITPPDHVAAPVRKRLKAIIGKYLP
ncbi:MAG: S-methyl-5'-thioadenosine phosphorylase [Candidatus Schekmanbacteria bacterium]|nr:S-methyl-5'-thioadenosine phosphorylase [Candidatus Schekmanbacteria bacterium]